MWSGPSCNAHFSFLVLEAHVKCILFYPVRPYPCSASSTVQYIVVLYISTCSVSHHHLKEYNHNVQDQSHIMMSDHNVPVHVGVPIVTCVLSLIMLQFRSSVLVQENPLV